MGIAAALDGARYVKYDDSTGLVYAWFGGHGVHVYSEGGKEVDYWSTGSFSKSAAELHEVIESVDSRINGDVEN